MAYTRDLKSRIRKGIRVQLPYPAFFMNEQDSHRVKSGSRVKMKYFEGYATGEVTIAREKDCKVIFDGDFDLAYDYYSYEELELIENE